VKKNSKLEAYMREIKGDRTFKQFSEDTGLSVATLSKYITGNGRGDVKLDTLRRIVRPEARPQGHVTLYDLMRASGLADGEAGIADDEPFADLPQFVEVISARNLSPEYSAGDRLMAYARAYENIMDGAAFQQIKKMVIAEIAEKAISSRGSIILDSSSLAERSDVGEEVIALKVSGCGRITDWYIYLVLTDNKTLAMKRPLIVLGQLALEEESQSLKRSVLTNNLEMYKKLTDDRNPFETSFKGDLSAILYDEASMKVAEEKYISVYDKDSQMFSILGI